jgi:hypothetical protein
MKKGFISSILALALLAFLFSMGVTGQDGPPKGKGKGGPPPPPAGPFTRTPDGHPDMQGYWNGQFGGAAVNIETGKQKGPIVDPADGKIPWQPAARAKAEDITKNRMVEEPELHCFQSGVPHQMWVQFGFQIAQPPGYVLMIWEFMHSVRVIPTDGRPHIAKDIKLFQGDPVGRWEGDTLVVETTNHNHKTWMDTSGNFKPETVHVVERFTMVDANTIDYESVVTDPANYTQPWKIKGALRRNLARMSDGRAYEQMEFACIEGNRDLIHYTEDKGGKAKQVLGK